jgi:hypothetical protein
MDTIGIAIHGLVSNAGADRPEDAHGGPLEVILGERVTNPDCWW